MAESGAGVVDSLVIATEFDESGLDRSVQAALNRIQRFTTGIEQASRSLPAITLSTEPAQQSLIELGAAFDRFIGEARDLQAFPDFTTEQAQRELGELIAAFPGLEKALQGIDPSGVFGTMALQARAAVTEIQQTVTVQQSVAQGTNAASTALVQEGAAFRVARESAASLTAALGQTALATRALAAQGTQPVALNVQPAVNAADTLISRMGLAQRSVTTLRQVLSTPLPPVPPDPNLPILARGYEGFAKRAEEARLAGERLKQTMLGLNAATRQGGSGADAWARGLATLEAQQRGLAGGMALSTLQASKLRAGLTGLAIQATGAAGPVGQLAQSILLFGGTGAVVGAAAGIAALAGAYHFLTTAARELREEQDKLVQSLLTEANSAVPKVIQAQQGLLASLEAERRAREAIGRLQLGVQQTRTIPLGGALVEVVNEELVRRQIKAIEDADRAQLQAHANQRRSLQEESLLRARTLTEAVTLRQADNKLIARASAEVANLMKLERDSTATLGQQLEIYRQRVELQKALTGEVGRTLDFWKQFRAAEAALLDQQIQLVRLGFGDPSILTKAMTEAAAKARDLTATEEERIAAANRLNAAASALIGPLERQVQATGESADNILRAFQATQDISGLGAVLSLTADTSGIAREITEAETQLGRLRAQSIRIAISGNAEALLREITTVEGRLAGLRAQRGEVQVTGDTSALTAEITEAETQLARLLSQSGTGITLTGDADPALREIAAVEARLASLRAERAQIGLSADTSHLTTQITDAERSLERLLRQRGAIAIEGDAAPLLGEIAEVEARLARLRSERAAITLSADTANLTGPIADAEAQLARLRDQGTTLALDADPTAILREMETVQARLTQLRGQAALVELTGPDTSPLTLELARVDAALARLKASGGQATDAFRQMAAQRTGLVEKQREAKALIAEFSRIGQQPLELKFETKLTLEDPDKAIGQILAELQQRALDRPFVLNLKPLQVPVEVDTSLLGDAEQAMERFNTDLAEQNPIWREANAQAEKLTRQLKDTRTNAQRMGEAFGVAFGTLDAIAGSSAFDDLGADASRVIDDVLSLGDAISSVLESASSGNVAGLFAAGFNALSSLFGGGGETEHDRIVRENTEAIKRNTSARSEAFAGVGGQADLARTIGQLLATREFGAAVAISRAPGLGGIQGQEEVERQLKALGLSLADLDRFAQAHGLDVLDDKGRIVAEALSQLQAELLKDIDAQLKFRQTLDNLVTAGDLRARISGEGIDAASAFQREIAAAAALGGTAIQDALSGLDVGDTEAVRKAFLGLVDAWEQGTLTAQDLNKLSFEDFQRLLESGAGFLDGFNQGLNDVANELNIIPKGFRNAALAVEAQIPNLAAAIPATVQARAVDVPLVSVGIEPTDALDRLIPEPIQIAGADLLDRLVAIGVIPATTALPATLPGDGAALPQIAASLGSSTSALAQIAASLGAIQAQPAAQAQADTAAAITLLTAFLAKAKIGHTVENVDVRIENDGKDPHDLALDLRRALEDIAMADYGRTDKWGQT